MAKKHIALQTTMPGTDETSKKPFVAKTENEKIALEYAQNLFRDSKTFADSYRVFCIHARTTMEPKRITELLLFVGFRPDVASRIKMIAMAPDEVFKPFEAKQIGFNVALEKARVERASSGKTKRSKKPSPVIYFHKQVDAFYATNHLKTTGNFITIAPSSNHPYLLFMVDTITTDEPLLLTNIEFIRHGNSITVRKMPTQGTE